MEAVDEIEAQSYQHGNDDKQKFAIHRSAASFRSGTLNDYGFNYVRSILGFVGRGFQHLVKLFLLNKSDGIFLGIKQTGKSAAGDPVSFIFQAIDLYANLENTIMFVEQGHGLAQLFALP